MSSLDLYEITIPVFIHGLNNLSKILKKGQDHLTETSQAESTLLEARLIDDMQPLIFQIQRVSDAAKYVAVRVGGADPVVMEDNEKTFEDLHARIQKTVDFLQQTDKAGFAGKEDAEVVVKTPRGEFKFTGKSYVLQFALPNFYFHVTTAYALLRMKGVPVGKLDFLGDVLN